MIPKVVLIQILNMLEKLNIEYAYKNTSIINCKLIICIKNQCSSLKLRYFHNILIYEKIKKIGNIVFSTHTFFINQNFNQFIHEMSISIKEGSTTVKKINLYVYDLTILLW